MTHPHIKTIERRAREFRTALENCPRNLLPVGFEKFPTGSCADASLLLGKYLRDNGLGEFECVLADAGSHSDDDWHSHAWLRQGELIIDITADQFPDFDYPVFVATGSRWHKKYRIKDVHPADYEIYDDYTRGALSVAYYRVVDFLEKSRPPGNE